MDDSVIKINLGSNTAGLPGWVNIDSHIGLKIGSSRLLRGFVTWALRLRILKYKPTDVILEPPPNFMLLDLTKKKLPFKDGSVGYCYTSHFIEHIPKYKAEVLLKDVHRVLKKDGVIRIVVPDMEKLAKLYLYCSGRKRNYKKYERFLWGEGDAREFESVAAKLNANFGMRPYPNNRYTGVRGAFAKVLRGIFPSEYYHKWMYDFEEMSSLLKSVGFSQVRKSDYKKTDFPGANELDTRPESSLFIEAVK